MGMEYVTCTNYDPSAGCLVSTVYQYVTLCNVNSPKAFGEF